MAHSANARKVYGEFQELPDREREDFLLRLMRSKRVRADIFDLALMERARKEEGADMTLEEYKSRRASRRKAS